ncbi:alpha/beta fold hydrolase [Hymenobacter elongatus]|uniref:Alpha/beta hydrolase n=1 Tax=Hymenobacter elongatus TaxID=877208 RepID=A0A4Z0PJC0_9BACT|nr:alpha/beta hydrolase [Hymenobacter elongatus]TGE15085.1 alpha/beta hydrolase [Hymenobacter elongatus]
MRYPIEQGFVEISPGIELHYEVYGQKDGQPLVVVNDFFSSKHIWVRYFASALSRYKLVVYDLRNQGSYNKIQPLVNSMSVDEHVADLARLLARLGLQQPVLVGISTSTLISKRFAVCYPEQLAALVLVSPFFSPFGETRKKRLLTGWLHLLNTAGPDALFGQLYAQTLSCRTVLEGQDVAFLAQKSVFVNTSSPEQLRAFLTLALEHHDNAEELRKIKVRTLLVAGEQDFLNAPSSIALLARLLPDPEVAIIDFCNHMPYFESQTLFDKALLRFIGQPEPAACY